MIGIVGAGVVGSRVAETLRLFSQQQICVYDIEQIVSQRLAGRLSGGKSQIGVVDRNSMKSAKVVVLCGPSPHFLIAKELLNASVSVVSTSDDIADCLNLLTLSQLAAENNAKLIVGAASSPGMSGLLVRQLAESFDSIDEVHVALHGTGGPACARQHHRALSGQSIGWHDGEWLRRPAGSGRELCWFPEPVGAYDCYRGELPDPLLIKRAFPELERVTGRVTATRRDRVFSRVPMMIPPQAEGGMGGLRVEVRGMKSGARLVDVIAVAERVGQVAGVVAASTAHAIDTNKIGEHGAHVLGDESMPNSWLITQICSAGINLHSFVRA
ncbi:MAG: hypothetical protein EBT42_00060 [Actinobacteria bacterium]|jgi:hypothetical protein|nr:hypothetical protein [Actinomycetota bacterium]